MGDYTWLTLPNPFLNFPDFRESIRCRISGRYMDILGLLTAGSSAIILAGTTRIGKSGLVHYLQDTSYPEWTWQQEIAGRGQVKGLHLEHKHFVQIDLNPLKTADNVSELFHIFITQCALALQKPYQIEEASLPKDLKGLRKMLQTLNLEHPEAQYFLVLDSIERLNRVDISLSELDNKEVRTPSEQGLALLNACQAIRVLVDLIDEFSNIRVILSIENLPGPTSYAQFTHVSADLARFTTMLLQVFSWDDTLQYLAQEIEDFDPNWAQQFREFGGKHIFTAREQTWILEQAGTHPYLLQQVCFTVFEFKKAYASKNGWQELRENDKEQVIETVIQLVGTFLISVRKRLLEAMSKGSSELQSKFDDFLGLLSSKQTYQAIPVENWQYLGAEMHYILRSEGIIRYDPYQTIHLPGAILCRYLTQYRVVTSTSIPRNLQLTITYPDKEVQQLTLSDLEYRLIKTLMQHPKRCKEEELMQGAWGGIVDHTTFTQRMYQLRKKLKEVSGGTEIITNQYGGLYSLNHPEWLNVK